MEAVASYRPKVGPHTRVAFLIMAGALVATCWLHLGTPLVGILFAYLALTKLDFLKGRGRWAAVAIFSVLLAALAYSLAFVIQQTVRDLPAIADNAIPKFIRLAQEHQLELPFTDYDSLKELLVDTVKNQVNNLGSFAKFARGATSQFILLVVGCVVAIGIFLNPRFEPDRAPGAPARNLYSRACDALTERFTTFYRSFALVMGAQIVISAINTALTGAFVLIMNLPNAVVVIGATFLCGLLPVVGNLISNTIIVGIGITVSPKTALIALVFLVIIHKLEYFLNSKIVGDRIRNPFWLTLLALILGEKLMGIPGMILAPVVMNYIKMESSRFEVDAEASSAPVDRAH